MHHAVNLLVYTAAALIFAGLLRAAVRAVADQFWLLNRCHKNNSRRRHKHQPNPYWS